MKNKEKTEGQVLSELKEPHLEVEQGSKSKAQTKQVEKDFQDSQENLRSILRLTSDMVFVLNPDGIFKSYYHPSSEDDLYVSPEEFLGRHFNWVLPTHIAQMLERAINNIKATGQTQQFDYPLDIKGSVLWYNARLSSFKYQPEGTPAILVAIRNITEHKKAEEALRESEEKYRATVEQSADNIYIMDLETKRVLEANATFQNLLGYTAEEINMLTIYDFIAHSPKDIDRKIEELIELKRHFIGERKYRRKDGSIIDVEVSGSFIAYGGRKALSIVSRDITERKRAEEKLKKVEQEKAAILNSMLEHVVYQDKKMRILWANKAAGESVNIDPEELVGRHCYEVWQKRNQPCVNCPVLQAIKTGHPHRAEMTTSDGRVWFISGHPVRDNDGHIMGAVEITLEITDCKKAEESLSHSETKYRTLVENSLQGLAILQDHKVIFINSALAKMLGYTVEELLSVKLEGWKRILHPEDQTLVLSRYRNRLEEKQVPPRYEFRMLRKDGTVIWVEMFSSRIEYGGKTAIQAAFMDITERKRIEEKLKSVEQERTTILNSMTEHVVYYDKETRILWANKAASESAGLPIERMAGRYCYDVWRQKSEPCINCPIVEAIKTGEPHQAEITNKDGKIWFAKAHPVRNANGGIVGVVEITLDITQKKKMQEELLKAKKLESIGILAGGIAHDFNNILTGILGNISVAKAKVDSEDEIFRTLVKAEKASLRAKDLTQQLLTFSKGGAPIKETTSIGELIEDSANFVLRGSNVKCEFSIPDGLWPVEIDKGQINQVLNNLMINADQSMPDGGVIKVSAENITIDAKDTSPLKKGKYVKLTIKDRGIGIPKQHLQKIFDPYFTTKKKGDGLGLATSYSIIKNHNGHVQVESELGTGSTLIIYLPASRKKITKKKLPEEKPLTGKGRILVMDDEDVVREVVGDLLSILGYEVEFAKDGDEVIELYKKAVKSSRPFDAVIMDLTVPGGMGGKESIKKLLKIDPEVKAIVSSGYSNDPVMSDFKKYGFSGIVAKPFKMEELSQVLHQVLT